MNEPRFRVIEPVSRYDVAVVGAGPAGCITALELAKGGASVLLIDQAAFPRVKVCGCCVNPRAIEVLRAVGQDQFIASLGAVPLSFFTLGSEGRRATIRQPLGVAVSRSAFDAALVAAACENGATFLPATRARLGPIDAPAALELRLEGEWRLRSVISRYVVSATGLADSLRPEPVNEPGRSDSPARLAAGARIGAGTVVAGFPDDYAAGHIHMAAASGGYVGLVRLEDGRLNVAAALSPTAIRLAGGIGPLVESILASAGFPTVPGLADLPWKGTPLLSRSARGVAANGLFRVGDAAGYVEPFTGEGIGWALSDGLTLATILKDALGNPGRSPEESWTRAYRHDAVRNQLICRAARRTLRVPWMTRSLVRILSNHPALARPLLNFMHQPRAFKTVRWAEHSENLLRRRGST